MSLYLTYFYIAFYPHRIPVLYTLKKMHPPPQKCYHLLGVKASAQQHSTTVVDIFTQELKNTVFHYNYTEECRSDKHNYQLRSLDEDVAVTSSLLGNSEASS